MDHGRGFDARAGAALPRVPEFWLRGEHLTREERLDRLAADAELFRDLQATGFEGPEWEFFANELARYGIAVIGGWIRRGMIAEKCREKRIKVLELPAEALRDPVAVQSITDETVAVALWKFREEVLMKGVWDSRKGASLKTFFIGQCLLRYANVARDWSRHELPEASEAPVEEVLQHQPEAPTVETEAVGSVMAQLVLRGVGERAARILAMDAVGYRNAEIAESMGLSRDAVSSTLKRERARLKASMTAERARP